MEPVDRIIIIGAQDTKDIMLADIEKVPDVVLNLTADEFNLLNRIINRFEKAEDWREELNMMEVRRYI